ncbi:MAG TPA: uroporphyrinogen decarboxylase family protein [Candidatus Limnocylindrales bacterium]
MIERAEAMRGGPDVRSDARASTADALERIAAAYRHEPVDEPPVVIGDANYWITGEDPAEIPPDYFADGGFGSMRDFQLRKIVAHLARHRDAYVPFLFPWYGTGVVPSALGSTVLFQPGEEPAIEGPILSSPRDVRRLVRRGSPNPATSGLMPRVLAAIDCFRSSSDLPISFTDCQGPFNIALSLSGVESICLWMYDEPSAVHELMEFCTQVLIDWIGVQKHRTGPDRHGVFPHTIALPPEAGGVWISDDDCTMLSPALYREFVVPYDSRVLQAFGGGTLHYCGNAGHQLGNFAVMDGLVGLNVWSMGEFGQVVDAQRQLGQRLVLMVCDYTPVEMESYFSDLFGVLDPRGLILATFPAARNALRYGTARTAPVARDPGETGLQAWRTIRRIIEGPPGT